MIITDWIKELNTYVWGLPLTFLLMGTGLFLTLRLMGLQFRYLGYALKIVFLHKDKESEGDITHFQSLMTALAATIGIGNIVGVATAISAGGLGALFWMWVTAFVGMATKYGEAILAIKYREKDERGQMCGGPMYYIANGLGWKWLGAVFALFGAVAAFGIGNMVQAHSVADAVYELSGISPWRTGTVMAVMTGLVLIGGIRSIGRVTSIFVPFMASLYTILGLSILWMHKELLPSAFYTIVASAFTGQAATGGFLGSTAMLAMRMGVTRGMFSNEAGLGSAPIVAAAAKTDVPGRQAMVSMTATFMDTLIVCTITGLVIAVTGVLGKYDLEGNALNGAPMTMEAFSSIPWGREIITCGIILFAYSTILGWAYYGEKCCQYLLGLESVIPYRVLFSFFVLPGAAMNLEVVWGMSDIANGLMAFPNLIALLGLSGVIAKETKEFLSTLREEG